MRLRNTDFDTIERSAGDSDRDLTHPSAANPPASPHAETLNYPDPDEGNPDGRAGWWIAPVVVAGGAIWAIILF